MQVEIIRAWLVEGFEPADDDSEALQAWKLAHPDWIGADPKWYRERFLTPGLVLAEGGSPAASGCPVGGMVLLRTETAALEYGERDPVIASGLRAAFPVLCFPLPTEMLTSVVREPLARLVGTPGREQACFPDNGEGRAALNRVLAAHGLSARPL
jgi:hypothetical protein